MEIPISNSVSIATRYINTGDVLRRVVKSRREIYKRASSVTRLLAKWVPREPILPSEVTLFTETSTPPLGDERKCRKNQDQGFDSPEFLRH
jgi:hypothetical protein